MACQLLTYQHLTQPTDGSTVDSRNYIRSAQMTKTEILKLFGGPNHSIREAARQLDIVTGTIHAWPDFGEIPRAAQDRVRTVMISRGMRIPAKWIPAPQQARA